MTTNDRQSARQCQLQPEKSNLRVCNQLRRSQALFAWATALRHGVAGLALLAVATSASWAVVVISDGFSDADLNNNGTPLELIDVDIDLDETVGDSYEAGAAGGDNPIFPAGTIVTEISTVLDAADQGIVWTPTRGWTSSGDPKANIAIMDDSAGVMPETGGVGTQPVAALNSGYALAAESKGRGSSAAGFFGQTVALGPEVGDQLKVSFDFRVWLSAPNSNAGSNPSFSQVPQFGALRFGLYQDTDGQLGMTNPFAGVPDSTTGIPEPAIWGQEGGHFRGDQGTVGANGDYGWYTNVEIGEFGSQDFARINEETNDATGPKFLEGSDNDFVAKPDPLDPTFLALDVAKAYNLSLLLERATNEAPGDTIMATYTVIDNGTGEEFFFGRKETLETSSGDPDGISSDSWDYFAIRVASTSSEGGGDDYDFLLDNFLLEIFGSNAGVPADFDGDGDVDGDDFLRWQSSFGTDDGGDADDDGDTDGDDFLIWQSNFGTAGGDAAASAVPEPGASLLLVLGVIATCFLRNRFSRSR